MGDHGINGINITGFVERIRRQVLPYEGEDLGGVTRKRKEISKKS